MIYNYQSHCSDEFNPNRTLSLYSSTRFSKPYGMLPFVLPKITSELLCRFTMMKLSSHSHPQIDFFIGMPCLTIASQHPFKIVAFMFFSSINTKTFIFNVHPGKSLTGTMLLNIYLSECSRAEYFKSVAGVSLILKSMSSSAYKRREYCFEHQGLKWG